MDYYKKYKDHKAVMFYELPDQHARLLIQMHYDGLKQGEFFRAIVKGYIEGDTSIFDFIQRYKMEKGKSKTLIRRLKKDNKNSHELKGRFALDEEEIEDIFDILEKEYMES